MSYSIFHIPLIFAVNIPVIVVFTKYDLLFLEHYRACGHISSKSDRKVEAKKRADNAFKEVTKDLQVPFVPVSKDEEFRGLSVESATSLIPLTWPLLQDRCSWS
jgi:hypothetical protein